MSRPKKANINEIATVKIENAFWPLLEKERYSDITVLRITQEAGTNRNSFYYHYKDIDDLAYKAFMNNVSNEISKTLVSTLLSSFRKDQYPLEFDMSILPYTKRVMLCAGSDSPYLHQLVKDLLRQIWFDSMSIREDLLSEDEKMQVLFISAGFVEVLGSREINNNPLSMTILSQTEIGKAIITTMKNIALRQHNDDIMS